VLLHLSSLVEAVYLLFSYLQWVVKDVLEHFQRFEDLTTLAKDLLRSNFLFINKFKTPYLIAGNAEPVLVLLQDVLKLNRSFIIKSEAVKH
jgi:hypothetical protein